MRKAVMELIKRGVVLTLMFAFGSANATTWYVDAATGCSSHSGKSMSDAFSSIQTAIDKAAENDVIIVNDGIYMPISVAKPLKIKSQNGRDRTIIDGGGSRRCATLWLEDTKWYEWNTNVVVSGFTMKNGYSSTRGGGVKDGVLHNCIIKSCKVAESGSGGGAYKAVLYDCVIEGNQGLGSFSGGGGAYECNLYRCTVCNNSAPQGGGVEGGDAYQSVFYNNTATQWDGGGVKNADVANCCIYSNSSRQDGGGASYCAIYNCTVTKNSASQGGGACNCSSVYNSIVWGNSAPVDRDVALMSFSCEYTCAGNQIKGQGNIVSDPNFVDWARNDFRLRNDSPCVNAGYNAYAKLKYISYTSQYTNSFSMGKADANGHPRIKGYTVDMGAYENQMVYPGAEVGYVSAQQRYPWNGYVDVTFDLFGLSDGEAANIVVKIDGGVAVENFPAVTFPEQGLSGLSNGTWNCAWDAGADVPRILESNLTVTVSVLGANDSCSAKLLKLDTRAQPRETYGIEKFIIDPAWQKDVEPNCVMAILMQTQPGYKAAKIAEFSGEGVRTFQWDTANCTVPGVHLFTLTLKDINSGKVLKTLNASFNAAGIGFEPQPIFTDNPVEIPLSFDSWDTLGTFLNDSRAGLLRVGGVTAVPPTTHVVVISLGEFAVPSSVIAGLPSEVVPVEEYGVKVYHLHVREIGDGTSDLVAKVGDVPVNTLTMPPYNPDKWVEALYGMPPTWQSGEARTQWYAERDISRIEWYMTLVPQADIATYRANRAAALAEAAQEQPMLDLTGMAANVSSDALHSLVVWAKEDSVVDVFGKRTLNETNWTYAGRAFIPAGESAVGVVSESLSYFMTVVRAGGTAEGGGAVVTEGDSDHDGIPDTVEKMTYGTNPHSADTSGGGIPDWTKIYVYGLNPLVTDTDGDGYDDIEELMSGTDPKVPLPGADTSIRYYYDEDNQLIRVHCGSTGAMSATELTPNGNPKTVKERRATK